MGLVSKISDSLRRFTILAMVGRIEEEIGQLPVRRTEDGKRCVHPRLLEEIRKKDVRGELMEAFNKAFPEPGADQGITLEHFRAEIDANPGLPLNFCNKKIAEALADPTGESANLVRLIAAVKFADDPDSAESRLFREHGFVPSDDQLTYAKESRDRLTAHKRAN